MDLIERCLAAGSRCTSRPADDLSSGLRALLLARIEAREATLRRPLSVAEAVGELTGFARRLLAESRAVMRGLEDACLGACTLEGGPDGPR